MYVIVWEFDVKPERVPEFQSIYSSEGDWAQLFRQAHGYLGTELLRDARNPVRFLTIDRWTHAQHFANFRERWGEQYAALDARCEGLTLNERKIGTFIKADQQ
jgi:quinol monooxygenase YgiN